MPGTDAITVIPLETPALGDRSYLVHDGEVAFVVDPQRDIGRVLALLDAHHLRLTHVLESHIHNNYVTGGFALARRAGAAYLVNADDQVLYGATGRPDLLGPRHAGYRASIAASLLAAAGRQLVAIDDTFDNARAAGLPVTAQDAA